MFPLLFWFLCKYCIFSLNLTTLFLFLHLINLAELIDQLTTKSENQPMPLCSPTTYRTKFVRKN